MTRAHYWSCSKFADWLRGTPKPKCGTMEEWEAWYEFAEQNHPTRYWMAEDGLGKFQDFVNGPHDAYKNIKNYITNRFVSKIHVLPAHTLKKGKYYEYEDRLLHGMFGSLVDYVEIEEAWIHVAWEKEGTEKYKPSRRFWFQQWRCSEAGMDHLKWAAGLVIDEDMGVEKGSPGFGESTGQAQSAQEILELYRWWKFERPARPDPYEASGWRAHSDARSAKAPELKTKAQRRAWRSSRAEEEREESSRLYALAGEIENKYDEEDQEMMIRLVKIRKCMWT